MKVSRGSLNVFDEGRKDDVSTALMLMKKRS